MFRTVRHWWSGGRGKVTARLFLFEFVVVMMGVLAAQGLQSWIASRQDQGEGRKLVQKSLDATAQVGKNVNYWKKHGQCLRDHVEMIARNAVAGKSMSVGEIGRPGLPNVDPLTFSEDEWQKIASVSTSDRVAAFKEVASNGANLKRYMADISDQWATFRLIDGNIGPPSAEDRSRVRLATAIIDSRLRWMLYNVEQFDRIRKKVGVPPSSGLPDSDSLVDRCGLIKDWR